MCSTGQSCLGMGSGGGVGQADERLEQPRALARRAAPGLAQPVGPEHEAAVLAASRNHLDPMAGARSPSAPHDAGPRLCRREEGRAPAPATKPSAAHERSTRSADAGWSARVDPSNYARIGYQDRPGQMRSRYAATASRNSTMDWKRLSGSASTAVRRVVFSSGATSGSSSMACLIPVPQVQS